MTEVGFYRIAIYLVVRLLLVKPLGAYIARVLERKPTFLDPLVRPLERFLYRWCRVDPEEEMPWQTYTVALLVFTIVGTLLLYALQRLQAVLPLNPAGVRAVSPDLSLNTAVSFASNTSWQNYGGESTMSYLSQMVGITVQSFLSAAAGLAVLTALTRGLARGSARAIGNFWVDVVRSMLHVLLPLSAAIALVLGSQGVVQTLSPYRTVPLVEPTSYEQPVTDANGKPVLDAKGQPTTKTIKVTEQVIAVGPAASQIAVKQRSADGGGFFNVNSAHPFENPTPFSNFVEMLAILLIPAALTYTFGRMIGDTRQGWALLAAMTLIFVPFLVVAAAFEQAVQSALHATRRGSKGTRARPGREYGGERGPVWHHRLGAVRGGDDGEFGRGGQLDA